MKRSETILVGAVLIVGGLGLFAGVGLQQWDKIGEANTQLGDLNNQITALEAQQTGFQAQITALENNTKQPVSVNVRKFNAQNREEVLKAILDEVLRTASGTGNNFISLVPGPPDPPPEPPAKSTTPDDPNKPPEPPPPVLQRFKYDLAIRGTFDSLQEFLQLMNTQKELVEVSSIMIENEAGAERAMDPGPDKVYDPFHPLKLSATLAIYLQPE